MEKGSGESMLIPILIAAAIIFAVVLIVGCIIGGKRVQMFNPVSGRTVNAKQGFSLTYYFFGPFVPLFRGHISGFFLTLVLECISCGIARLIFAFVYNGMYINWLIKKGYHVREKSPVPEYQPEHESYDGPHSFSPSLPRDEFNGDDSPQDGYYQNTHEVFQPTNARFDEMDDDGETVALSGGIIQGISGMYQEAEIQLKINETVIIGRDSAKCNLVIDDKAVSRRHCGISYDAFNCIYKVQDFSTYGVYLADGTRIPSGQMAELQPGTQIRLGSTANIFLLK
jgi:hypothetical protein